VKTRRARARRSANLYGVALHAPLGESVSHSVLCASQQTSPLFRSMPAFSFLIAAFSSASE